MGAGGRMGPDTGRPVKGSLRFRRPPSSASHALGTFPLGGGRLSGDRKGRLYENTKACPVNAVGADDLGGPRAHTVRSYGSNGLP